MFEILSKNRKKFDAKTKKMLTLTCHSLMKQNYFYFFEGEIQNK